MRNLLFEPDAVALSEKRLREMVEALQGSDPCGRRSALRVPVAGYVTIVLMTSAGQKAPPRRVGVYDLSRSGIAVVDREAMPAGSQFDVQFTREAGLPIEVLCTARHSRRQGDAFIIGAEFGVPWLSALGAAVAPGPPQ